MRLKKVIFYQAVKLWDGNSVLTVNEGENKKLQGVTISIENHMITLECPTEDEVIVVGTSNMREARYWREPSSENQIENGRSSEANTGSDKPWNEKDVSGDVTTSPVPAVPAGFDPSKYAGKTKEEKVVKPANSRASAKAKATDALKYT